MKAVPFLSEVRKLIPVEFNRNQRQAVGLRTLRLFPDGRDRKTDVSFINAAHLIRVMVLNLNPTSDDFFEKVSEHASLIDSDGNQFIKDFAEILENAFLLPSKEGLQAVQRISFSLDRPFVSIIFESDEGNLSEIKEEPGFHINYNHKSQIKTYRTERTYGLNKEVLGLERFAILKRHTLIKLSMVFADDLTMTDTTKN